MAFCSLFDECEEICKHRWDYFFQTSTYEVHSQVAPTSTEEKSRRKVKKQSCEKISREGKQNYQNANISNFFDFKIFFSITTQNYDKICQ